MYDLHRLRLLRELSLRGTLAEVAHALGYSPSAVSHALGLLEREAGATLLEPAGRGVRLTPVALALVDRTEAILRELDGARADVAAARTEVVGSVRIATFQTAAHALVLDAIERLAHAHAQLELFVEHLDAEAAIPALLAREFDVVLSEEYPGHPRPRRRGVRTRTLLDDPLMLATPSAWSAEGMASLADAPWVMEHPGSGARAWATAQCRSAGFEPNVRYTSSDLALHAALVAAGRAAAFIPALGHTVREQVRIRATGETRTIAASVRDGSEHSPALIAVIDALRPPASPEPSAT